MYSGNGAQFTGGMSSKVVIEHGVAMSHPPLDASYSVGLAKAYVKQVKKGLTALLQQDNRNLEQ